MNEIKGYIFIIQYLRTKKSTENLKNSISEKKNLVFLRIGLSKLHLIRDTLELQMNYIFIIPAPKYQPIVPMETLMLNRNLF